MAEMDKNDTTVKEYDKDKIQEILRRAEKQKKEAGAYQQQHTTLSDWVHKILKKLGIMKLFPIPCISKFCNSLR